jgi:2-desacetyl-2-hydroxyethyl bacteriochlorophyllide A dehydrogenase
VKRQQVVFTDIGEVSTVDAELETVLRPDELLVKTLYSFVSTGTELAKLSGRQLVPFPYVPGNRAVCEVLAVGDGVGDVSVGDVVMTHTPHASHAITSGFRVRVPVAIEPRQAAAAALALVAMTAVRVSAPELGDRVVVLGLGGVGIIAAQLFAAAGVEVIGVDPSPERLELARSSGIASVVQGGSDAAIDAVLQLTGPAGAEIVVEATGIPRLVEQGLAVAKRGGQLVLLGSPRGAYEADLTPILNHVHLWQDHGTVTIKGAHEWQFPVYSDQFTRHSIQRNAETIFGLMERGAIDLSATIGRIVRPADAPQAYEGMTANPAEWSGVLFDWSAA